MTSPKARCWILIILFGVAAVLTSALNLTAAAKSETVVIDNLPMVIGDFTGVELPVEQSTKDILETQNVLTRDYVSPDGVHIILAVIYYEQYRVYFHMPEGCMVGEGSIIAASEKETLTTTQGQGDPIVANKLILAQPYGEKRVLYFFMVGDLITASYPQMRFHLMMEHLKRRKAGAALVRFSTTTDADDEQILETLNDFIEQMVPVLRSHLG